MWALVPLRAVLRSALVATFLLLPLAQAAVDPHPRTEPALALDGAVTALALAGNGALLVAGRSDPDGATGETAGLWRAWDAPGNQVRSETADRANCQATALLDACLGSVVDVAVDATGTRIVVAAQDDNGDGRLILATRDQGIVGRTELDGLQPVAIALSEDGRTLAVALRDDATTPTGMVRSYAWAGTGAGAFAMTWSTDLPTVPTGVALGAEGRIATVAGDRHYRFSPTGSAYLHDNDAVLNAVAFAGDTADHWSIAGAADGGVLLYSDAEDTAVAAPHVDLVQGTSPQTAVAASADATLFAAGDQAGIVRLYRNHELVGGSYYVTASPALDDAVTALAFSADGRYLAVAAGKGTYLWRTTSTSLQEMWRAIGTAPVTGVALTQDGETVVASTGASLSVYTAVHAATLTAPAAPVLAPGGGESIALRIENTGNREETVQLTLTMPSGWEGALETASVRLDPGQVREVRLNVTAPSGAGPGTVQANVALRVQGIPATTAIPLTVGQVHRWVVQADGPLSQPIPPGGSVSFPVLVTNLGNGADNTTVLATTATPGWTVTVQPATVQAAAGAQGKATIVVAAPADAGQLASATVQVRLGSDATAALDLTASVGARFAAAVQALGSEQEGQRGVAATYTVRVTNQGNAPDRFLVALEGLPLGWTAMVDASPTVTLAAGQAAEVRLDVTPAAGAAAGTYALTVAVHSEASPSARATTSLRLTLEDIVPSATTTPPKGSPGLGPVALLGALVGAVLLAGTRRR